MGANCVGTNPIHLLLIQTISNKQGHTPTSATTITASYLIVFRTERTVGYVIMEPCFHNTDNIGIISTKTVQIQ